MHGMDGAPPTTTALLQPVGGDGNQRDEWRSDARRPSFAHSMVRTEQWCLRPPSGAVLEFAPSQEGSRAAPPDHNARYRADRRLLFGGSPRAEVARPGT